MLRYSQHLILQVLYTKLHNFPTGMCKLLPTMGILWMWECRSRSHVIWQLRTPVTGDIVAVMSANKTQRRSAEFQRFDDAMRKIMTVSKEELHRRIEADPHKTGKRKPAKPASAVSDHASEKG